MFILLPATVGRTIEIEIQLFGVSHVRHKGYIRLALWLANGVSIFTISRHDPHRKNIVESMKMSAKTCSIRKRTQVWLDAFIHRCNIFQQKPIKTWNNNLTSLCSIRLLLLYVLVCVVLVARIRCDVIIIIVFVVLFYCVGSDNMALQCALWCTTPKLVYRVSVETL